VQDITRFIARSHRPVAEREASPQPDAVGGRAANPEAPVGSVAAVGGAALPPRPLLDQIRSFSVIGAVSTLAYAALFTALRSIAPAAVANAAALVVTAIGNTAANRRLTFDVRDRASLLRDHAAGLVGLGLAVAITTMAVGLLATLVPDAGRALELAVLIAANAVATVTRFIILRSFIAADRKLAVVATNLGEGRS
jgi:putative flippase GtrA